MAGGNIKGITVQIDGDTSNLNKALKSVDSDTKKVQNELKQVENLLKFDPSNVDLLAQKQQLLGNAVEGVTQRLDVLRQAQSQVEQQFQNGEIGQEAYRRFQREIIATEGQLEAFQNSASNTRARIDVIVDANGINRLKSAIGELGAEAKRVGKEIGSALSDGAKIGAAGVGALVIGSTDLNNDLARLRTNAALSGQDFGLLQQSLAKIVTVTGETDSAVETLSNLLASGFEGNQLEQVVEGINGAAIRFSDTLKTEGIADGIQETFATGEAIGSFAELLERSGVDLETFNGQLAKAKEEGTEADLVLQTLADLGLNGVTEKFKELNPELEENNEATFEMQKALADLAIALTPLITFITDIVTKITEWAQENETLTKVFAIVSAAIVGISSVISVLLPIVQNAISIFNVVKKVFSAVRLVFLAFTGPVGVVIAIIGALITIGISLYKNWDSVSKFVVKAFGYMKTGISVAASAISSVVSKLTSSVIKIFKTAFSNKTLLSIGRDLVLGLANGIKGAASLVVSEAKKLGSSAAAAVKSVLKIKSPSRVMMELGGFAGQGLAIGLQRTSSAVEKASNAIGQVIINSTKANNASIKKLQNTANQERLKLQDKYNADLRKLKSGDNKKRIELENKLAKDLKSVNDKLSKDVAAEQSKLQQEQLKAVNDYIDKKKKSNQLSLIEEAAYLRESYRQFKTGTDARIELENKYRESVQNINEAIIKNNEDYLSRAQKIDDNLIDNIQKANDDYQKAYDDRYKTVRGYYGLLSEVKIEDANPFELLENLRKQGDALREYSDLLNQLRGRGIGNELYEELKDLGPSSLGVLRTLNNLTDDQLNGYVALFEDKLKEIQRITDEELAPLRDITDKNIEFLTDSATVELSNLNQEWQKSIVDLVGGTENNLSTLNQVGKNAAQQLIDGLTSLNSELVTVSQDMAKAISETINKSLNLGNVRGSLFNLNTSSQNASGVLSGSTSLNSQYNNSGQIILQQQQQDNAALVDAVLKLANNQPDVKLVVDGRELASVVNRNQYNTASLDGLVKGVALT